MGYKEIGGSRVFRPWKNWEVDEFVKGRFVSTSEDNYGKTNYNIKVSESNFGVEAGETLCLNSNGSLDYKMESVEEGSDIMVQYLGTEVAEKGPYKGKEFHNVKVLVAENDVEEASDEDDL